MHEILILYPSFMVGDLSFNPVKIETLNNNYFPVL